MFSFQLPGFVLAIKPIQDRLTCSSLGCNGLGDPDCPRHPLTCGCDWNFTCNEHRRSSLHRHIQDMTTYRAPDDQVIHYLRQVRELEACMYTELEAKHSFLFWEDASQDALDPIAAEMDAIHECSERHRVQIQALQTWDEPFN